MSPVAERCTALAFASTAVSSIPVISQPSWTSGISAFVAFAASVAAIVAIQIEKRASIDRHKQESKARLEQQLWSIEQHKNLQSSLAAIQLNQKMMFRTIEGLQDQAKTNGE